MPIRAPTYDNFTVGVEGGGSPRLAPAVSEDRASTPGRRLQQVGQEVVRAGEALQNNIDEAYTREADANLSTALTKILNDPQAGYLNSQGKNAVEGFKGAQEAIEQAVQAASQTLKNPLQQRMFETNARARSNAALASASSHAAKQTAEFNATQADAQNRSYAQEAATNPFDTNIITSRAKLTEANARRIADLKGLSPEAAELFAKDSLTSFHGAVLASLVSRERGKEARDYLAAHESEISTDKLPTFRDAVKQASVKSESTDLADSLAGIGSRSAQESRLKELYDKGEITAEVRDATASRLDYQHRLDEQARQENARAALGAAQEFALNNPGAPPSAYPVQIYQALKATGNLDALTGLANMGGGSGGGSGKEDPALLAELLGQLADDPEGFSETFDPRDYIGRLSPSSMKMLAGKARNGGEGDGDGAGGTDLKRGIDVMRATLAEAGIDTSPTANNKKDPKGATRWREFQDGYFYAIDAATKVKGKRLTDQELREVGNRLLADGAVSNRTATGTVQTQRGSLASLLGMKASALSPALRNRIKSDLLARGRPVGFGGEVSDAEVMAEYRRRVLDQN